MSFSCCCNPVIFQLLNGFKKKVASKGKVVWSLGKKGKQELNLLSSFSFTYMGESQQERRLVGLGAIEEE